MDTTDQKPMPMSTVIACTTDDPSSQVYGPDMDGTEYSGRAGADFDSDSGVLELVFVPFEGDETEGDPQEYAPTTVRFVEVEKLLTVLARLEFAGNVGQPGVALLDAFQGRKFVHSDTTSGEWWRAVLAEKLDAHTL